MATFIYGTELNLALEDMIKNADNYLLFISPYIKLHDRIKDELKRKKEQHELQIVIVFGKNDDNLSKSISPEDINFLKDFPNVKICYEKNLHAKYYASEDFSLLTSMNLHQFSQNTNVEAGILMKTKTTIKQLTDFALSNTDAGDKASEYFEDIIKHSEVLFDKFPEYESGFFGITKKYKSSKVLIDKLDNIYNTRSNSKSSYRNNSNQNNSQQNNSTQPQMGYCIRTGVSIPFNPSKPYSYEAYKQLERSNDWNSSEKYCHLTGKRSNGRTSMTNPILE